MCCELLHSLQSEVAVLIVGILGGVKLRKSIRIDKAVYVGKI